jgi:hypothetical protein
MALKKEFSILTGTIVGVAVYGIYQAALPSAADVRSLEPNNKDVAAAERTASWTSAGTVAIVSLIAQDPTVFILGGSMVVAMAWMHRHANWVNPLTSKASTTGKSPEIGQQSAPEDYSAPKMPDYSPTF